MSWILLLAACNTETLPSPAVPTEAVTKSVENWNVLLSGSINGEYEPCG